MWPPREASHPSSCVPSQKRPSLLKNSSAAAAATFRDQDMFHFNAKSWSNLGTKTRIRPVLTVGPHFSTGWPITGTTLDGFPLDSVRRWVQIMRIFPGYLNHFSGAPGDTLPRSPNLPPWPQRRQP